MRGGFWLARPSGPTAPHRLLCDPAQAERRPAGGADQRAGRFAKTAAELRRQMAGLSQGTVPISPGVDTSMISKSSEVRSSLCFSPPGM